MFTKYVVPVMAATGLALAASAYPAVSNSSTVQLNQWTYKYREGMAKAAETGRPAMLVFVNTGGCSYCKTLDANVFSGSSWGTFLTANPMVLIWVDQARESYYTAPSWKTLIDGNGKWGRVTKYPEVVILSSSGIKRDQFAARSTLGTSGGFIGRVSKTVGGAPVNPPVNPPVKPPVVDPSPAGQFPAQGVGIYGGVLFGNGSGTTVRGVIQMAARSTGRITVKVRQGAASTTLRVSGVKTTATDGSFEFAYSSTKSQQDLRIQVDPRGFFTGTFNNLPVSGRRILKDDVTPFTGYYTTALDVKGVSNTLKPVDNQPKGVGYLTLTVNSRASVKYSGLLADGTKVSGTSSLQVYDGADLVALGFQGGVKGRKYACFTLYTPLYRKRGVVAGLVWIDAARKLGPEDNLVYLTGSEWQYPGRSATSFDDRFTAEFDNGDTALIGAYYAKGQSLAVHYAGMHLYADGESVANVIASEPSIKTDTGLSPSLRAVTRTGLMRGKLKDPKTGASASYKGVLVPPLLIGDGFYLVKDGQFGLQVKRSYTVRIAE